MKTRLLALLCALFLTVSALPVAGAVSNEATRTADTLATLGFVQGTSKGNYALNAPATRAQAAVLLVRISGREGASKSVPLDRTYTDMPAWAAPAACYAIHMGWMKPTGKTTFSPNATITAQDWCMALLRMMGYTEFVPENAPLSAQRMGLISKLCVDPLPRSVLFQTLLDALMFPLHDTEKPLIDRLIQEKRVSSVTANALGLLSPALTPQQTAARYGAAVFRLECFDSAESEAEDFPISGASGFFITHDGIAVTNFHCIDKAVAANVSLTTGEVFPVEKVLWYNRDMDLALLKVGQAPHQPPEIPDPYFACLDTVSAKWLRPGDPVYTLSYPLGIKLSVTNGIVSTTGQMEAHYAQPCIVNTAPISHGSSGGPLMNDRGQVTAVASGTYILGDSMYLALPIDTIQALDLDALKAAGGKTLADFHREIQ